MTCLKVYSVDLKEIQSIDVSISHCKSYAIANVTALYKE